MFPGMNEGRDGPEAPSPDPNAQTAAAPVPKTGNKPQSEPMPEEEQGEDANLDDQE